MELIMRFFHLLSCCCTLWLLSACGPQAQGLTLPPPPTSAEEADPPTDNPGADPGTPTDEPVTVENAAAIRSLSMGVGWNLGNNLDAWEEDPDDKDYLMPDEQVWGNPKVQAVALKKVHDAGFTTIRIPVTWLAKIGPAPDYLIDAAWLARVTEVVGYAYDAGFSNIIVDTHHDGRHEKGYTDDGHWVDLKYATRDPARNAQIKEEIRAVWGQIATNFKDYDERLMFEGFNEPNDGTWSEHSETAAQCRTLNEWLQVFVETVRASGGYNQTRWLGVPTYSANPEYTKYLVFPTDPAGRTMLSVHYYEPTDFTLGTYNEQTREDYLPYTDWGHTGEPGRKYKRYDEDHIRTLFARLRDEFIAKGIPVYIGETGCSRRSKQKDPRGWAFSLYYMEYMAKAARTYGLPVTLWDCGGKGVPGPEHHYYFRHDTGEYYPDAQEAVEVFLRGWQKEDADYTLESVYNSAPVF